MDTGLEVSLKENQHLLLKIFGSNSVIQLSEDYVQFEKNLKKSIIKTGNEKSLDIYVKLQSANQHKIYDNYARIFQLLRILGVNNIYDIGCGNMYQAFLLINYQSIFYTGIDYERSFVFEYMNKLFAEVCGDRIKFYEAEYPFVIDSTQNNAAISCFCLGTILKDEKSIKNAACAISRDFERIIMNIDGKYFNIWEAEMSLFKLYKIGDDGLIFGTKFSKDICKIKEKYICINNQFEIGFGNNT